MILALIIAICVVWSSWDYVDNFLDFVVVFFIFGCAMGVGVSIVISFTITPDHYYKEEVYNLESMRESDMVNGSFFLGSGHVGNKFVYIYYTSDAGVFRGNTADIEKSAIKYTNGKPSVTKYVYKLKNSFKNWFFIPINMGSDTYAFEVPEGSIKSQFKLAE